MRAWPGDDTVAHLIFVDHQTLPVADDLAAAIDHARRKGARAIRTSAMFPDAAGVVLASGFEPIDRLAGEQRHGAGLALDVEVLIRRAGPKTDLFGLAGRFLDCGQPNQKRGI